MTARRPSTLGAALVVLALALTSVLGACGVGTSGGADRAPSDDVPFGLLEPDPSSGEGSGARGRPAEVFLFDSATGRLRTVVVDLDDGSVETVLFSLLEAPADDPDVPSGNPLGGDGDAIRSAELSRGVVTVDLGESFGEISGPGQLAALAEIVYTATARPGVGQVAFTLEGQPIEVPTGDGALESRPVTRSDYPDLAPEVTEPPEAAEDEEG